MYHFATIVARIGQKLHTFVCVCVCVSACACACVRVGGWVYACACMGVGAWLSQTVNHSMLPSRVIKDHVIRTAKPNRSV